MRRMGGSGRLGLIGPVLDTGATCDAATSSTWCGGATWSTSSSEPSAYTLRTRCALAATPLPARGRDVVEMGPGAESCRLPQSRTPWRSVTNARMPSAASSSAGSSDAHTTTKISNLFRKTAGLAGFGPFNPLLRSQITSLMPAQCGARLAMLAVIAPAASAYSLFGTSSRSHAVTAQIAAQAPVAAQVPFAHTAVQMRTRNTAVQMSEAPAGGKKKVFVLGGDGFCGWPTALHLSNLGHDVVIIDDLSRRKIDVELGASSLTPISTPEVRVATWNEVSGKDLKYVYMNLANEYDRFLQLIKDEKPDTMVHFAEQRAAPYSMKNSATKRYTIENNMGATHNALCAIVESELDIHLVHLGTMGVYGYGNSGGEIPEGYIDVTLPGGREKNILHPAYPGSIYHSTKRAAPPLQLEPSPSNPAPPATPTRARPWCTCSTRRSRSSRPGTSLEQAPHLRSCKWAPASGPSRMEGASYPLGGGLLTSVVPSNSQERGRRS